MLTEFDDTLVWLIRLVLAAGLAWGAWLCIATVFFPARPERTLRLERFATFALLVLLVTTLGGALQPG